MTQTIEQLAARVRELEAELQKERLQCMTDFGQYSDEIVRLKQLLAAQAAHIERLREAFIGLMRVAPKEVDCENMHHERSDQHGYDEPCPVVSKYAEAIEIADKVLSISDNSTEVLQQWLGDPIGSLVDGILRWNTEGGPDEWRKRKDYEGPLYRKPEIK